MNLKDIEQIADRHLQGKIKILKGPAATPEHRLVAQYHEIRDAWNSLDRGAFKIGYKFLADLKTIAPDNVDSGMSMADK